MDLSTLGLIPFATKSVAIGKIYGKLTVEHTAMRLDRKVVAICRCACGKFPHIARADQVKTGKIASCGCGLLESVTKHGLSNTILYRKWQSMMQRCYRNASQHHNYADRGITVCKRWHVMTNFIKDMQPTYFDGAELDRINNDKGYTPRNCRWATRIQQARNKRNNHVLTWRGKTQTITEWSEELNIPRERLKTRITRGWSIEKALTASPTTTAERWELAKKQGRKVPSSP